VRAATVAVGSDEPFPSGFGADGKMAPGLSPQFIAWAKAHGLTTEAAADLATHDLPGKVLLLAETGDRRAIPLLRRALSSPNFMIQGYGTQGLADLQDKASIPFIIAACRNAPEEVASALSEFLAEFDDPVAQRAAKEFPPPKEPK
jgi:HEAT repeat protein